MKPSYLLCVLMVVLNLILQVNADVQVSAALPTQVQGTNNTIIPQQFRIAFAGPGGISITWNTMLDSSTICYYWRGAGGTKKVAVTGQSSTYGKSYTHVVKIKGLLKDTRYFYSCGSPEGGYCENRSFVTAPAVGVFKRPFSFALVGDMGVTHSLPVSDSMIKRKNEIDFIYHVGDFAYADDSFMHPGASYESIWTKWFNQVEPLSSELPYMTLPGNHEASCQEVVPYFCSPMHKNFTSYRNKFNMPNEESGGTQNMWYSFDYGIIHFISISTETDYPGAPEGPDSYMSGGPFGDQLAWLQADLEKAVKNRKNVPWIIMAGHRPIFFSKLSKLHGPVQDIFLPFVEKYGVDFYLAGHQHLYERYYPMRRGKITQKNYYFPEDTVYIVQGGSGNIEGHELNYETPDFLAYRNSKQYGWGRFNVLNRTSIQWQFIAGHMNKVLDEFVITKAH